MGTNLYAVLTGAVLMAVGTARADDVQPFTLPVSLQPTLEEFGRFTLQNANRDLTEWQFSEDENCIFYSSSAVNNADDWVFIPVEFSAADTYLKISVEALATGGFWYDESLELAVGPAAEASSMRTILTRTVELEDYSVFETTFANDVDGMAWIGIHVNSVKNRRTLKVRNIVLQSYATPIPLKPEISASVMDGLEYAATVNVPSRTVQGNPIDGTVDIRFSVDGVEMETFAGLTPGSELEVSASLAKGEHQLSYVALLDTDGVITESEPATESVKAMDLNINYVLPFEFGPADENEFGQCALFDANGDGTEWTYKNQSFYYSWNAANQANDWMILPAVDFEDSNRIEISVEAHSEGTSYVESFEVWLGREATVGSMTVKAINKPEISNTQWQKFSKEIPIDTGIWYVGLHATSAADQYGLYLRNIRIESKGRVALEDIGTDADEPVEYFNLQGIPVATPEKGSVVIMRRGHKTVKTIVR